MSKVYFVTGISGAGKSTLVKELRSILTSEKFKVHDFDEIRVPHNPNKSWRIDTTNYWLKITHEYTRSDKNILLCGQFMPSEVERAPSYSKSLNIKWGFLKIDNETIETRLTTYRKLSKEKIETFKNWAKVIEDEVRNEEYSRVFEVSNLSPAEITNLILEWINRE